MDQRPNDPDPYAPLSWSGSALFDLGEYGLDMAYLAGAPICRHINPVSDITRGHHYDTAALRFHVARAGLAAAGLSYKVSWEPAGKWTMADAGMKLRQERASEARRQKALERLLAGMATGLPFVPSARYTVTRE
jgi:hypothetical protein